LAADIDLNTDTQLPRLTLILIMIGASLVIWLSGRLTAVAVPDTASYADFPFDSWTKALTHRRTPGYPALLWVVRRVTGSLDAMPVVHLVAFCGGVLVFHSGLRSVGAPPWSAVWMAGSLLSSNVLHGYVHFLATDTLAAAVGVATAGLTLIFASQPAGSNRWLQLGLLAANTTLGWLIRPNYLFLVLLVPVLSVLVSSMRGAWAVRSRCAMVRFAEVSTAVMLPLGIWCGLRWLSVGAFGVVSFGGYNLVGVTGQWLDRELTAALPADLRPLAQAALDRREQWPPETLPMSEAPALNYQRMELRYDSTIADFQDGAQSVHGDDNRRINTDLKRLGLALVWQRPLGYGVWLAKSGRQAVFKTVGDFVVNPVGLALILFTGGTTWLGTVQQGVGVNRTSSCRDVALRIVFVAATLYWALSIGLTILVCPPLGRFTDAAAVLLPAMVAGAALDRWQVWRGGVSGPTCRVATS
jgi:hypothetical protein